MRAEQCLDRLSFLKIWMMAEKPSLGPLLGTLNFSGCWDELPASPTCLLSVVVPVTAGLRLTTVAAVTSSGTNQLSIFEQKWCVNLSTAGVLKRCIWQLPWSQSSMKKLKSCDCWMLGPQRTWKKTEAPLAASPLACPGVNVQSEEPLYG